MVSKRSNKFEKDQPIPKFVIGFANALFILGIVLWFCEVVYAIYRIYEPFYEVNIGDKNYQKIYYYYILIGIFFGILFSLALRLKNSSKVNMALVILALATSVYSVETFLEYRDKSLRSLAEKQGVPFDSRRGLEVLKYLKDDGFSQNQIKRQGEIDRSIVKAIGWEWSADYSEINKLSQCPIIHILKLYNIRHLFDFIERKLPATIQTRRIKK